MNAGCFGGATGSLPVQKLEPMFLGTICLKARVQWQFSLGRAQWHTWLQPVPCCL